MEDSQGDSDALFDKAVAAIEAAARGNGQLSDARAAFMEIAEFRPRGMEPELQPEGPQKTYGQAANTLKMALDSLEGDQIPLALSYINVAKIKLERAREA